MTVDIRLALVTVVIVYSALIGGLLWMVFNDFPGREK
jgi:hypothetical protein